MHVKPIVGRVVIVLMLTLAVVAPVADENELTETALDSEARFDPVAYAVGWLIADRNSDGTADYAVQVDERGYKLREAMDFNLDGRMDDFYFYSNNVLQRQEVDSNFDQAIDIWIYMWRGVYVQKWERDTDYDGAVDMTRDYGRP